MKYKCILIFVASFFIGMCLVFLSPMEYKTVFVYPTPDNVKNIQYKDTAGTCYQFEANSISCDSVKKVSAIPAQS